MGTVSTTLPADGQTIDASDVNTPINAILSEFNGNIDNDNIKAGANISGSKLAAATTPLSVLDTDGKAGWITGVLAAPNTVTNNGNRSYDLVFNSTDYTDELSEGMRLRTTRTVSAPTQCADLESGSSQYFNKTSPAAMTFTDDFVVSAWVKLESYTNGAIISRYNGTSGWELEVFSTTGQILLKAYNAGAANYSYVLSYQSIPLGKWVHITAQLDMSAFTATTTTSYIMIDGVDVPCAVARAGTNPTALVQAGNLEIGSMNGGTLPFDGKLAQVAVFNAKVTQATMRGYMSQGLSGSETSLISAYSFSNAITDLNTTNANNLTAQGSALATNVDSPFGSYLGGTLDYAIITKTAFSTNTTLTVQVPEGCTIPTSGGVSAVAYSTQDTPYGFPRDKGRWRLTSLHKTLDPITSNATYGSYMSAGWQLIMPVGAWEIGWQAGGVYNVTTTSVYFAVSSTALTGLAASAGSNLTNLATRIVSPSAAAVGSNIRVSDNYKSTSALTFLMYTIGATTSCGIDGSVAIAEIFAEFNYL